MLNTLSIRLLGWKWERCGIFSDSCENMSFWASEEYCSFEALKSLRKKENCSVNLECLVIFSVF